MCTNRRLVWVLPGCCPTNVRCHQDCVDEPGHACGGRASSWTTRYGSAEECCATVPWKPYDMCAVTASPVSAPPTTSFPTQKPTKREKLASPASSTSSPTGKPTHHCPSPQFYLFKSGSTATCVNDPAYPDGNLFGVFGSKDECCSSSFAAPDCQYIDVCHTRWYGECIGMSQFM